MEKFVSIFCLWFALALAALPAGSTSITTTGAGKGGPAPIVLSFEDTDSTASGTNITFSSAAFGAEASDRKIIVGWGGTSTTARTISSATIGGVSASVVIQAGGTNGSSGLIIADVPTGTTGDVVLNFSGAMSFGVAIGVWRVTGLLSSTADSTATDTNSNPLTTNTLDVPAGGFGIGIVGVPSVGTGAWTGLTENFDLTPSSNRVTGASDSFVAAQVNLAVDLDAGDARGALSVAAWGN